MSDKGEFDCRCECCVYWRRHTHRLVASRDKAERKLRGQVSMWRSLSNSRLADARRYLADLLRERQALKALRRRGPLDRLLGREP